MKRCTFRVPVSPGSAEAQVRWGGKIKYILIAYFLRNTCAKNYHNQRVYVKIIASQRWDVFLETRCITMVDITVLIGHFRDKSFQHWY